MMKLLSVQNIYVHQYWNLDTTNYMATFGESIKMYKVEKG